MRISLIHNPGAGNQGKNDAGKLEKLLRDAGHKVRYQSAKQDGWRAALKWPADLVVVAGGDGTVARVTRRMVGRGVPVTLLPSGTANNIGRTLGLLERSFEELVRGWENARRVKLDVGTAQGPWGERYFVEGVGVGLFANLLTRPKRKKKNAVNVVEGALRRLKDAAAHCEPVELVAALDGKDISGRYLLLEAINLRYVGPNLFLAPDSQPGDGEFDVVFVTEAERDRLLEYLERWQDNRERLAVLPTRRGKRLQIEWTGFELHIDDKLRPKKNAEPEDIAGLVEARIDGAAVEFLVPDAMKG
ncbi:MAG: diacylglycerol/lipid kinase family protein [Burkholderiales bacterium]